MANRLTPTFVTRAIAVVKVTLVSFMVLPHISCVRLMRTSLADMSPAVFQQLAPLSEGVIQISWEIV